ncbi:transposable element Tcb1 transposase [Trichonephila clavipes]|nr:transposable element Tcb1 transposase [Trichonephila clavipes]
MALYRSPLAVTLWPSSFLKKYGPMIPPVHKAHQTLEKDTLYIHWCAKIKDEVEKLAYQLNEEAERTERPIRRLSKVMYGSTCADMQVDVMGECLSSIKHAVGTTSGCFYPRSNHWEVGGRPQCDKCGCRVRIAHSIVSRLWRQFQTTGTAIRGSVGVVHEEPHLQMTGTLSYRLEETGGRQREKSLYTRHRRRSLWCREHRNWRDNEWGRVLFTDESRFSLSSDSHRILIWRERGSRNHPSNIIERDRYGGRGVLVWGGIMLGSRTETFTSSTQIQSTGPVIVTRFFFHMCVF